MQKEKNSAKKHSTVTFGETLYSRWQKLNELMFDGVPVKSRIMIVLSFFLTAFLTYSSAITVLPFPAFKQLQGISHPLADALLCASGITSPAAYIALIYHAYKYFSTDLIARVTVISFPLLLRTGSVIWIKNEKGRLTSIFREPLSIKLGASTVASMISCGIFIARTPLTLASLPAALTALVLPPLLTLIFHWYFSDATDADTKDNAPIKAMSAISNYSILALCVYVSRMYSFMGCSLATLVAIFLTAVTAVRGGVIKGGVTGLILGVVLNLRYSPILAVTGVFAGTLSALGASASVGISCAIGCGVALFAYGTEALYNWIPENIIATAITAPIVKYDFLPTSFPFHTNAFRRIKSGSPCQLELECSRLGIRRLYGISKAFSDISVARKNKRATTTEQYSPDTTAVCQKVREDFCESCPLVAICWESRYSQTSETVRELIRQLYSHSRTNAKNQPPTINKGIRCLRADAMKRELVRICESPEMRSQRFPSQTELFLSEEYECMSEMLKHYASTEEKEFEIDDYATVKVIRAAKALAFPPDSISVYGKRIKNVVAYGKDLQTNMQDPEKLRIAFSKACGAPLCAPRIYGEKNEGIIFEGARVFEAETSYAQRQLPSEDCNGDTTASFSTDSAYHHTLICDGMGSGIEAAESSGIAASIAEKLLLCQLPPELAARMIGSTLRKLGNECFSTLDLLTIDLMNGKASILKNGATVSYVLRDGDAQCLSASSLPLGITSEATPERICFNLKDGDTVVLISDGIAQDDEDGKWISDYLKDNYELHPQHLAAGILSRAASRYVTGAETDDMTVSVTRIKRLIPPLNDVS